MDVTAHTSISSVSRRRERLGNKKTSFNIFVKSKKLGHPSKLTNLPERSDTPPRAAAPTRRNLLEARTARTLRPSVPLSLPPPLTTLGCVWRRRPRHACCGCSSVPPSQRPRREVRPFAAAPPPACTLPCAAARFATQDASVRLTMQAGTR